MLGSQIFSSQVKPYLTFFLPVASLCVIFGKWVLGVWITGLQALGYTLWEADTYDFSEMTIYIEETLNLNRPSHTTHKKSLNPEQRSQAPHKSSLPFLIILTERLYFGLPFAG